MKTRKYGFNYAVKAELREAVLNKIGEYIPHILFVWCGIILVYAMMTNAYIADLNFQSYALEQSMNTSLWYRVMTW